MLDIERTHITYLLFDLKMIVKIL